MAETKCPTCHRSPYKACEIIVAEDVQSGQIICERQAEWWVNYIFVSGKIKKQYMCDYHHHLHVERLKREKCL